MKKLTCLLLLILTGANAQIVNIPDANFKALLLAADDTNTIASTATNATIPDTFNKIDANSDGEIQLSEAVAVTLLNLSYANITDLTGLDAFTNLRSLKCRGNQLTNLNTDPFNSLVYLDCRDNNLTSLTVNNKLFLQLIFCENNQLTGLNLANLPSLMNLYCGNNNLTSLDVNSLTALRMFGCQNNQLSQLNVSNLVHLLSLGCENNVITSLNTAGLNELQGLSCQNNQLTSLIMSSSSQLATVDCSNNQLTALGYNGTAHFVMFNCSNNLIHDLSITGSVIMDWITCQNNQLQLLDLSHVQLLGTGNFTFNPITIINIKNGFVENFANFSVTAGLPFLEFICADNNELTQLNSYLFSSGLYQSSTTINDYCSFVPGGNYNSLTGSMIFDANANGCDVSDLPQPGIKIRLNDGVNQMATFTNNSGNYTFYTLAGTFGLTPDVENPSFFSFAPATANVVFPDNNNNVSVQDFCIAKTGIHPDVEVAIAPIVRARPGFDAWYQVVFKNKGTETLSGTVTFGYDDSVLDFVSSSTVPAVQNNGSVNWNYTQLLPFENRSFYVQLHVNSPTDTPPVNIGDNLNFQAVISPEVGDEFPLDNQFGFNQLVVGSFDPNDITCLEGNTVPTSAIGNYLHYAINFENTGTDVAENIVVRTEIDPAQYDINSLQLLTTSHNAFVRQTGNTIEFIFQNLNLDTGGHGNILLKIRSKNNLGTGDTVSKKADIFFDYNAPVITGLAVTTFQALNTPDFETDDSISVYPNPAQSIINVKAKSNITSVQLYDVQGRLLQTQLTDRPNTSLDISGKTAGVYFLKITSETGTKVQKIIKE